jgi:phage shock protein PspC (stress-responsive transcriptional regulator)
MLERNTNQAWVGGVAAGLAEKYNVNLTLIRLLFVAGFLLFGLGLAIYGLIWMNTPESNNSQITMNFSV